MTRAPISSTGARYGTPGVTIVVHKSDGMERGLGAARDGLIRGGCVSMVARRCPPALLLVRVRALVESGGVESALVS